MNSTMKMTAPVVNEMPININNCGIYEAMQQMIHQMQSNITSKIDSYQQKLNDRINDIEARISSIHNCCTADIDQLTECVQEVRSDALMARDKLLRVTREKDLVISGVPLVTDEDLNLVFDRIAKHLGYNEENVPAVELARLPSKSSTTILCRFARRTSRNKFFQAYLRNLPLCLVDIGYATSKYDSSGSQRIFINESLSKRVRDIRSLAMRMKKAGRIQTVTTRNGVIRVKLKDTVIPCHSKQDLLDILNLSS